MVPYFESIDEPLDPYLKFQLNKYLQNALKDEKRDMEVYKKGNHYFVCNEGIFFATYDDEVEEEIKINHRERTKHK